MHHALGMLVGTTPTRSSLLHHHVYFSCTALFDLVLTCICQQALYWLASGATRLSSLSPRCLGQLCIIRLYTVVLNIAFHLVAQSDRLWAPLALKALLFICTPLAANNSPTSFY
jgi:hypothetical protein